MAGPTPCPDRAHLQALLSSSLPADEQDRLVGHLDDCSGCQDCLEEIAAAGTSWIEAVRHAGEDQPPGDSAFWPALDNLEKALASGEQTQADAPPPPLLDEVPLDFLQPSDDPTHLGRLGHFEVVEVIGRGGMGVVLKAFDGCLRRAVAIKVLDPTLAHDERARQRFCREARAAAAITHENVVAIHQVERDETTELPFLVMQLVAGESLQERLDRGGPLGVREIVRIGMETAAGLAAAHGQGLIHRDVKPANILLEHGVERVKLTDFGLARAAEDVKLTQTGLVAGTPLYMAPEQARGEVVDHRSDLFSLGSVLYAASTGRPPFDGSTPFLVLRQVTEEPPPPIQEINATIPDWLVEIIDRLQAKNPAQRFQSAVEVASVLAGQLAQLPPATDVQRVSRSARRLGRAGPWWKRGQFWAFALTAPLLFLGGMLFSEVSGLPRFALLGRGGGTGALNADTADAAFRGPPPRANLNAGTGPIWSVAFAPDGGTLAMALDNGTVQLWDLHTNRVEVTLHPHQGAVWAVAFSPDGQTLATGSSDTTVKLWDVATGKEQRVLKHSGAIRSLAFAGARAQLFSGSRNGAVTLWDLDSGGEGTALPGHAGEVVSVAASPDGTTLASASGDETIKLWDAARGQERTTLRGHKGGIYGVAFSPDGTKLASGGWDHVVRLWDAGTGASLATFSGHTEDVWGVAFSPDGQLLASASEDRSVKLWHVPDGREVATFKGHTGTVYTVAFAPDGRTVAAGGRDGTVKLWDVPAH